MTLVLYQLVLYQPHTTRNEVADIDLFSSSPPGTSSLGLRWARHNNCGFVQCILKKSLVKKENKLWWNDNALSRIVEFLNFNSLISFSTINRLTARLPIFDNDIIWWRLCKFEFGVDALELKPPKTSRQLYKMLLHKRKELYHAAAREASLRSFSAMLQVSMVEVLHRFPQML